MDWDFASNLILKGLELSESTLNIDDQRKRQFD
jgi:hypothetical protein